MDPRDAPKRRGRIPQSAWPRIVERYKAGATLSAIAREFDCTPSAISYILRKASGGGDADGPEETGEGTEVRERRTITLARADRRGVEPTHAEDDDGEAPGMAEERVAGGAAGPVDRVAAHGRAPMRAEAASVEASKAGPADRKEAAAVAETGSAPVGDPLEARLLETAKGCIRAYRTWRQEPSEEAVQALREGLHNLRKTLARVEIEASTNKRDETVMRPIPIPTHRSHRSRA